MRESAAGGSSHGTLGAAATIMAMKPITFAVPNSVSAVLYEIERLRLNRSLSELSCRLLQMFYVVGWDDGFMTVDRADVSAALNVRTHELNRALSELEALDLIGVRALPHDAAGRDVVEILAMSSADHSGLPQICWWDYYRVQLADYFLDPGEEP